VILTHSKAIKLYPTTTHFYTNDNNELMHEFSDNADRWHSLSVRVQWLHLVEQWFLNYVCLLGSQLMI